MIIFYYKKGHPREGEIVGTIGGRLHNEEHLKMWVGSKKETDRIVVQWRPSGKEHITYEEKVEYEEVGLDADGDSIFKKVVRNEKVVIKEFEPDHPQKEEIARLEINFQDIKNYKVDLKSKKLIKNG